MPRFRSLTAALCLSVLSAVFARSVQAAPAACPDDADIVRAAYPGAPAPDAKGRIYLPDAGGVILAGNVAADNPFGIACKPWPANPDLLLVAVPVMADLSEAESADGHAGDLDVLVVERATLRPVRKRRLQGLMMDDAVRLTSLSFDTARYDLTTDQRAFGIRISREAGSRSVVFSETSLRLFIMSEHELHMVLDGMLVRKTSGDWDTNCAAEVEQRSVTLALADKQTLGYRNLNAAESRELNVSTPKADDCVETTAGQRKTQHTLKYDGKRYVIPKALQSMDRGFVDTP